LLIPPAACAFERRGHANLPAFICRPLPCGSNAYQAIVGGCDVLAQHSDERSQILERAQHISTLRFRPASRNSKSKCSAARQNKLVVQLVTEPYFKIDSDPWVDVCDFNMDSA
jgi:hypothetical protein